MTGDDRAARAVIEALVTLAGIKEEAEAAIAKAGKPHPDAIYHRYLDEDTEITVYRMGFGWRVNYGETGVFGYIEDCYCFKSRERALEAAAVWNGKSPILDGWHRNPITGRRREDGDPAKEYIHG